MSDPSAGHPAALAGRRSGWPAWVSVRRRRAPSPQRRDHRRRLLPALCLAVLGRHPSLPPSGRGGLPCPISFPPHLEGNLVMNHSHPEGRFRTGTPSGVLTASPVTAQPRIAVIGGSLTGPVLVLLLAQ